MCHHIMFDDVVAHRIVFYLLKRLQVSQALKNTLHELHDSKIWHYCQHLSLQIIYNTVSVLCVYSDLKANLLAKVFQICHQCCPQNVSTHTYSFLLRAFILIRQGTVAEESYVCRFVLCDKKQHSMTQHDLCGS